MQDHDTVSRFQRLADAFEDLAIVTPALVVDRTTASPARGVGWDPRRNFHVCLESQRSVFQVSVFARAQGTEVQLMSSSTKGQSGEPAPELLEVDLTRDYRWNAANFNDATRMARLLVEYMQRRLDAFDSVKT